MKKLKQLPLALSVLIISLAAVCLAFAWTEPGVAPPESNIDAPLNTSINAQAKEGALVIGANEAVEIGLAIQHGKAGIGVSEPKSDLDVAGEIKLSSSGDACSADNEGAMRYLNSDQCLYLCNGTDWTILYCVGNYTLTMADDGNGTAIDVAGSSPYNHKERVNISASPNLGYVFSHWSAPAGLFDNTSSSNTVFTMPAQSVTVTANFTNVPTYTLTMADNGSGTAIDVTGSSPYNHKERVNISASPNSGYLFSHWSAPAGSFDDAFSVNAVFTMPDQNVTVAANFDVCGTDITYGGQIYSTVEIGSQCWLAENLNVTKGNTNQSCSIVRYCYDNNRANCDTYGGLYTWNDAMCGSTTNGAQGICPAGWHLPTDGEFKTLEMYLGMSQEEADGQGFYRGENIGAALKDDTDWNGTNTSGFTALPGGYGTSHDLAMYSPHKDALSVWMGQDWGNDAWMRGIREDDKVGRSLWGKSYRLSVRCLMD